MSSFSSVLRIVGVLVAATSFAVPANTQTLGCTTAGPGGLIPLSGTGGTGSVYQTTFPTAVTTFVSTLACTPPGGSTCVTSITLRGITHTWAGDLQVVLTDPAGNRHNIFCRNLGSCNFGGDYTFIELGGSAYPACTGTAVLPAGTYDQHFGPAGLTWTGGNGGSGPNVLNTPMYSIPSATGNYTLTIYDWAGGDTGTMASWEICFGTPPPPPPPPAPILATPTNGSVVTNPVTLTWNASPGATFYDVDVDGVVTTPVVGTTFPAANYAVGNHTWKVRGENGAGAGPYSTSFTFTVPAPPPPTVCSSPMGGGGLIPIAGTGGTGAIWPGTLPTSPLDVPLVVTVPAGSTQIGAVKLRGLTHTWVGDLQVVLEDPTGLLFNIFYRPQSVSNSVGYNCDVSGDYNIYEASGMTMVSSCAAGDYIQTFGDWPSGSASIVNTLLSGITINGSSNGTWILHIYDWAGGDVGALTNWELCFAVPSGPVAYCTAGTSTNNCVPSIGANAQPSVTMATNPTISIANVEGQKFGIIFYGINNTGFVPAPWAIGSNSFLCVKGPTQRTGSSSSGGTLNACNGTLSLNWNTYQTANPLSVGNPFSVGDKVYVQGWYRDPPAPKTTNLSDALELTLAP